MEDINKVTPDQIAKLRADFAERVKSNNAGEFKLKLTLNEKLIQNVTVTNQLSS